MPAKPRSKSSSALDVDVNAASLTTNPLAPNAPEKPKRKKRPAKSAPVDQAAVDVNAASLATNLATRITLNVNELSQATGWPVPTLNGWRSRGGGPPFVRCGRSVRYPLAAVQAWLADRVVGSTAEAAARDAAKDRK